MINLTHFPYLLLLAFLPWNAGFAQETRETATNTVVEMDYPASFADLMKNFEGKVVYIDILASWCVPCIAEFRFRAVEHHRPQVETKRLVRLIQQVFGGGGGIFQRSSHPHGLAALSRKHKRALHPVAVSLDLVQNGGRLTWAGTVTPALPGVKQSTPLAASAATPASRRGACGANQYKRGKERT